MKKFLKIFFIVVIVLIALLAVVPYAFKPQIKALVTRQLNNNLKAESSFESLKLSFFKNFPLLSVEVTNLYIKGVNEFSSDTLVAFESLGAAMNPVSYLRDDEVDIRNIWLHSPVINARVNHDSTANWDIFPESGEEPQSEVEAPDDKTGMPDVEISLKNFEILNAKITYIDAPGDMEAHISGLDFTLSGDFSKDMTDLNIKSGIQNIQYSMDGINYLTDARVAIDMIIAANLEEQIYELKDNTFSLNNLTLGIDGMFKIPEDAPMFFDMNYYTTQTSFKTLLSLIPAVYKKDFESVETHGSLRLDGKVTGYMSEEIMPNATLMLNVKDAGFSYPDLPSSVEDIQIDLAVNYNGVHEDSTRIDLNHFHLSIADNPVDAKLTLRHPVSDPFVNGTFKSNMDLSKLKNAIPLENSNLSGIIDLSIDFMGKMSMIENENYESFKADGYFNVEDLEYTDQELSYPVKLTSLESEFTPRYVDLTYLDAEIGKSDIQLKGKIENFFPYSFSDGTLKGSFYLSSSHMNLNQFMSAEEEEEVTDTNEVALEVVEVPEKIYFVLHSELNEILYDDLIIRNVTGEISVNNSRLLLSDLNMYMLEGNMRMAGEYNTQDIENPLVDFSLDINDFSIPAAFQSLSVVQEFAPVAKYATGLFSTELNITSLLEQDMMLDLNTLTAEGNLSTSNLTIKETPVTRKISDVIKSERFLTMDPGKIKIKYSIRNGKIEVDPFDVNLGKTNLTVSGEQSLDKSIDYDVLVNAPAGDLGQKAAGALNQLAQGTGLNIEAPDRYKVNLKVTGTTTNPKITPEFLSAEGESATEKVKETVKKEVRKEIEEKKEKVKEKASEKAREIISEAEKKAERIRKEAKNLADEVRKEANDKADKLLEEAKSPVTRRLAKPTADKIRQEGEDKAQKIEQEADKKAKAVIETAKEEAEKLN